VTNDENDNSGTLQENKSSSRIADLTMDYQRPHANGLIKLGFKISHNTDGSELDYLNVDELHNIVIPDPRYTNTFDVNTTSAALYGSWQWRPKEKWAALLGIRAEYGRIDTHQRTTLVDLTNYYFNALPSGFATYKLTEDTNLRFSYSRRVRRPMSFQLNPFVVHINDLTESAGNAQLRPVITDSVEVGVETHMGGLDASMRSYCTNERGAIQLKNSLINNTILLLRPENVGKGRASGIEFSLNGKLTKKVSINSNANISYTQQRQFDLAGSSFVRNNSSLTVQSKISYEFTSADQLQLSVNAQGRTLSGRGYREPTFSTELSVRHTLTPTASVLLKIRNLFDKQNIETITNLPTLKEQSSRKYDGRTVYLGVSWRFGGVSRGSHALPN
jgi:outer membrane receptor protein involved in Fe transport